MWPDCEFNAISCCTKVTEKQTDLQSYALAEYLEMHTLQNAALGFIGRLRLFEEDTPYPASTWQFIWGVAIEGGWLRELAIENFLFHYAPDPARIYSIAEQYFDRDFLDRMVEVLASRGPRRKVYYEDWLVRE